MAESSACLFRSLSQPVGTSGELHEGDRFRALTSSISFGRFMSESLAWEKWSSFSHNRYLEEAEKSSKPGSVAEKKAYFEARYKRIAAKKAAALLEQQNAAGDTSPEQAAVEDAPEYVAMVAESSDSTLLPDETMRKVTHDTGLVPLVDANGCDFNVGGNQLASLKVEEAEAMEHVVVSDNPIPLEFSNQPETVEELNETISIQQGRMPLKDADERNLASAKKKKQTIYSSKFLIHGGAPNPRSSVILKSPAQRRKEDNSIPVTKRNTPVRQIKEDNSIPIIRRIPTSSVDKRQSTSKTLHMSIVFPVHATESCKTSPDTKKIGYSRTFAKTFKDTSTRRQTPSRASVSMALQQFSAVPQPDRRTKTLKDCSLAGSRTADRRSYSHLPSVDYWQYSGASRSKSGSPMVSSSFGLRCEEKAAKGKEEKVDNDLEKMHHTTSFKAKALAMSHHETEFPSNHIKKSSGVRPQSPKPGRKPTLVQDISQRPPWRSSVRADSIKHVIEKNNRTYIRPMNSTPKKKLHENASPNIQLIA